MAPVKDVEPSLAATLHNLSLGQFVHPNVQSAPPPMHTNPANLSGPNATLHALNQGQFMHHCQPGPPIHTNPNSTLPGPDGCNLFIFHLPNELTNIGLYTLFAAFGTVVRIS